MTAPGSAAPNTALPATITLAPAAAASSIVAGARPPSTCDTQRCSAARTPQRYKKQRQAETYERRQGAAHAVSTGASQE